ncbi:MAG: aldehyde dehydrogenase (NADP(+)) [Chitinophagaceae bacterium]|nr:aldehyde dehydrogenase (NADP(+)) [Chitinophagaceae bacterium]
MPFTDNTIEDINSTMENSWTAFLQFRNISVHKRAAFMKAIAANLESSGDALIQTAMRESNLPEARLKNERNRTIFQLTSYAEACANGDWMDIKIDYADANKNPPKPDIRKINTGLGPVVVFGASNFPFAYSTAGGDTASAFAAGCPVVVKAHPAHPETSTMVAELIQKAALSNEMPANVFQHVYGSSNEIGKTLVMHNRTKAVGFTGSFGGGKQLYDWAQQRKEPIPVFAEMGSINPVVLFPQKLQNDAAELAVQLAGSVTLGVGQFCTNPGLIIGVEGNDLSLFIQQLTKHIQETIPGKMLHAGISSSYQSKRAIALAQSSVVLAGESNVSPKENEGIPTVATTTGRDFMQNPILHQEVFGPYTLVVQCATMKELKNLVSQLDGQLTLSMMATAEELLLHKSFLQDATLICGRINFNMVPTGVEVCSSMQHGGPFPASTDSRFGSVGADAIKRFVRPICYQNFPKELLPEGLNNYEL